MAAPHGLEPSAVLLTGCSHRRCIWHENLVAIFGGGKMKRRLLAVSGMMLLMTGVALPKPKHL